MPVEIEGATAAACPWCGGEAEAKNKSTHACFVRCNVKGCGARGPIAHGVDIAIKAWNRVATRPVPSTEQAIDDLLKRMEKVERAIN